MYRVQKTFPEEAVTFRGVSPQARRGSSCREYAGEMVGARSLPVPTTVLGIKLS